MSTTLTIAKREFRSNFDSPLAYVVICFGLIALGVIFFFMNGGFWQADRASLVQLFSWAPIGLSFLISTGQRCCGQTERDSRAENP